MTSRPDPSVEYQKYFPKGWAHAVGGTMKGKKGMIEYYELYPFPKQQNISVQQQQQQQQPIMVAVVKVGNRLDGPVGYVHGGIVALLFDDVMGYAGSKVQSWSMTRDLSVEYRNPQPHEEYVVIRVYFDETKLAEYHAHQKQQQQQQQGNNTKPLKKRVFLRATCRSLGSSDIHTAPFQDPDDGILYSRATITMVQTPRPPSARDSEVANINHIQSRL